MIAAIVDVELTVVRDNTQLRKLLSNTTSRSGKETRTNTSSTSSCVTLSGLLDVIDGIWSSLENYDQGLEKEERQQLISIEENKNRKDGQAIELSYCDFESFKVLANIYLLIDQHSEFDVIRDLLEVTNMTPSDVSENMLPNCSDDDAGICLDNLICALEKAKDEQDAKKKAAEVKKSRKKLMVCELIDRTGLTLFLCI
ncbi:AAA-ATPase At3g28540-like [Amaranthus tricolor]|uniref:AAA-ATPase At3g28540-like n=1 Tax=Amaranthus tricolor TaxID=29722 RepID=UPI00258B48EA|nr:AAA-ATPase At3g28540-like [Amaranthus tricolor]